MHKSRENASAVQITLDNGLISRIRDLRSSYGVTQRMFFEEAALEYLEKSPDHWRKLAAKHSPVDRTKAEMVEALARAEARAAEFERKYEKTLAIANANSLAYAPSNVPAPHLTPHSTAPHTDTTGAPKVYYDRFGEVLAEWEVKEMRDGGFEVFDAPPRGADPVAKPPQPDFLAAGLAGLDALMGAVNDKS